MSPRTATNAALSIALSSSSVPIRKDVTSCDNRRMRRERTMFLVPMPGNVATRCAPDPVEPPDMIQETLKASGAAGTTGKPAMQPDRHHLGRVGAFTIQIVEGVPQVGEEFPPVRKPLRV